MTPLETHGQLPLIKLTANCFGEFSAKRTVCCGEAETDCGAPPAYPRNRPLPRYTVGPKTRNLLRKRVFGPTVCPCFTRKVLHQKPHFDALVGQGLCPCRSTSNVSASRRQGQSPCPTVRPARACLAGPFDTAPSGNRLRIMRLPLRDVEAFRPQPDFHAAFSPLTMAYIKYLRYDNSYVQE